MSGIVVQAATMVMATTVTITTEMGVRGIAIQEERGLGEMIALLFILQPLRLAQKIQTRSFSFHVVFINR